jgi:hypothetical protein
MILLDVLRYYLVFLMEVLTWFHPIIHRGFFWQLEDTWLYRKPRLWSGHSQAICLSIFGIDSVIISDSWLTNPKEYGLLFCSIQYLVILAIVLLPFLLYALHVLTLIVYRNDIVWLCTDFHIYLVVVFGTLIWILVFDIVDNILAYDSCFLILWYAYECL